MPSIRQKFAINTDRPAPERATAPIEPHPATRALLAEACSPPDLLGDAPVMISLYSWQGQVLYANASARASLPEPTSGHRFVDEDDYLSLIHI